MEPDYDAESVSDQGEHDLHNEAAPEGFEPDPDALTDPDEPEEWSA